MEGQNWHSRLFCSVLKRQNPLLCPCAPPKPPRHCGQGFHPPREALRRAEVCVLRGFLSRGVGRAMGNSCVTGASPALLGKTRDPAFKWKFYGFSVLLDRGAVTANSAIFCCCGYDWFLQVSPMHKKSGDNIPHIALSLLVNDLKAGDILSAVFEFSMYNHSKGTYHGCKASSQFHIKKWWSEKQCLIPLEQLLKSSDFLVDDSCVFGVRILKAHVSSQNKPIMIPKKPITVQNIFLQKKGFIKGTYTWTMNNFLDMRVPVCSPAFEVGGHKWYINMHPLGDQSSTNSLSLYLHLHDLNKIPLETGMVIELTLSILDQKHEKHYTVTGRFVFAVAEESGWGWSNFIPLKTLTDSFRCYIVGSNCMLKADVTIIGSSNDG